MSEEKKTVITVNETTVVLVFIATILNVYKDANTTMILVPTIIMLVIVYEKIKIKAIKYLSWVTMAIAFGTVIYRQFPN